MVAALCHTAWNLLLKRATERFILAWWSLVVGALLFSPLFIAKAPLPRAVWPLLVASCAVEVVYFIALTRAYRLGDFSLVYPIARGFAPALLLLWSVLFLRERPTAMGLGGLALLLAGLVLVGWTARGRPASREHGRHIAGQAIAAALLVALCISIYTTIDGAAVKRCDPLLYTVWIHLLTGLLSIPVMLRTTQARRVLELGRMHARRIIAVGALSLLAYSLALLAYSMSPVSYAGAIRESSVIFGSLAGTLWMNEGHARARVGGAVLMAAGIVVIALAG